jgi:hypothetical protein
MKLTKLQDDLILTMCDLEIIFPPSFLISCPTYSFILCMR